MAVYGEVDVAVEEGLFDFFGEEPLALHLVKADVLNLVSTRLKHHDLHGGAAGLRRSRTWCACHNARSLPRAPCECGERWKTWEKVTRPRASEVRTELFEHGFFGQLMGKPTYFFSR